MVVGIVTNVKDPDGLARVKVKYPSISDDLESNWARLVTPMAGAGRGFEFIPEVNDEVLVAFEYDDINKPYILGSLWNGQDQPPESSKDLTGDGKVSKRVIHSRSGHKIILDDTSGEEKISIYDKSDSNFLEIDSANNAMSMQTKDGHKIVMDSNGISIESAGKLTIKSTGNMDITTDGNMASKATGNIEMNATGNLTAKSTGNTSVEATATLKVKGLTASVNGDTMTEIKGAMVKIN
jgi:uncharacterized protein involved in type VI secretion and phage assembly